MVTLKNKIKIIESLPQDKKKKKPILIIIIIIISISIITILSYTAINQITPYLKAIKIEKIVGKKINITECNTMDYIIIGKDKSYSLNLTDENCNQKYYEGNIIIKNNKVLFNDTISGIIDNNYNIIINNKLFESDKNE